MSIAKLTRLLRFQSMMESNNQHHPILAFSRNSAIMNSWLQAVFVRLRIFCLLSSRL